MPASERFKITFNMPAEALFKRGQNGVEIEVEKGRIYLRPTNELSKPHAIPISKRGRGGFEGVLPKNSEYGAFLIGAFRAAGATAKELSSFALIASHNGRMLLKHSTASANAPKTTPYARFWNYGGAHASAVAEEADADEADAEEAETGKHAAQDLPEAQTSLPERVPEAAPSEAAVRSLPASVDLDDMFAKVAEAQQIVDAYNNSGQTSAPPAAVRAAERILRTFDRLSGQRVTRLRIGKDAAPEAQEVSDQPAMAPFEAAAGTAQAEPAALANGTLDAERVAPEQALAPMPAVPQQRPSLRVSVLMATRDLMNALIVDMGGDGGNGGERQMPTMIERSVSFLATSESGASPAVMPGSSARAATGTGSGSGTGTRSRAYAAPLAPIVRPAAAPVAIPPVLEREPALDLGEPARVMAGRPEPVEEAPAALPQPRKRGRPAKAEPSVHTARRAGEPAPKEAEAEPDPVLTAQEAAEPVAPAVAEAAPAAPETAPAAPVEAANSNQPTQEGVPAALPPIIRIPEGVSGLKKAKKQVAAKDAELARAEPVDVPLPFEAPEPAAVAEPAPEVEAEAATQVVVETVTEVVPTAEIRPVAAPPTPVASPVAAQPAEAPQQAAQGADDDIIIVEETVSTAGVEPVREPDPDFALDDDDGVIRDEWSSEGETDVIEAADDAEDERPTDAGDEAPEGDNGIIESDEGETGLIEDDGAELAEEPSVVRTLSRGTAVPKIGIAARRPGKLKKMGTKRRFG